jgi:branched-chain amino acid transport system substrate-binding protein
MPDHAFSRTALLLGVALIAACSSNSATPVASTAASVPQVPTTTTTAATTTTTAATTTTTAAPATTVPALEVWGADYVGGPGGIATGTPIRIGFVNQTSFSPESPAAAAAATAYLNTELGGVSGRPIELVSCPVETESDATACAARLGTDPTVAMIMTGALQVGGSQLYDGVAGTKPILIGSGLTASDFLTTNAHTYTVGGAGVVAGLAHFITAGLPQPPTKVAVVHLSTDAGTTAVSLFVKPILEAAGTPAVYAPLPDPATTADVNTALGTAGALDADVVFAIVDVANCNNLYDALADLKLAPTVVSVGLCTSSPVATHLAGLGLTDKAPNGWYFGSNGYSQNIPNLDAGIDTYNAKIAQYGVPESGTVSVDTTGLAPLTFATTLTVAKLMNTLGDQATDPAALEAAITAFTGPMMFQAGPIACGKTTVVGVTLPAVCASRMGIQRYIDGTWTPISDGNNGKAIDITNL